MTSNLAELQARWSGLKELAARLTTDDRRLSTPLTTDDDVVQAAQACKTPLVTPLTVGTLLAAVLGELDGVEFALESIRRNEHPGEDLPDPLAIWQQQANHIGERSSAHRGT